MTGEIIDSIYFSLVYIVWPLLKSSPLLSHHDMCTPTKINIVGRFSKEREYGRENKSAALQYYYCCLPHSTFNWSLVVQ